MSRKLVAFVTVRSPWGMFVSGDCFGACVGSLVAGDAVGENVSSTAVGGRVLGALVVAGHLFSVMRFQSITAFRLNRIGEYDSYCRSC